MSAPMIYCWDEETKLYSYSFESQLDPLETEKTSKEVYCGLPLNGTYEKPSKEKKGYDIVWNEEKKAWEYVKQKSKEESKPYEPTELEKAYQALWGAKDKLAETDYRALKYAEGLYTEEEYAPYKAEREQLRQAVREAQAKVDELEQKNK